MLGSIFRFACRQSYRTPLLFNIPKQPFVNVSTDQNTTPNQGGENQPEGKKKRNFCDKRVAEITKVVPHLKERTAKRIFKNCDYEKDMVPALNLYKDYGFNEIQLRFLFKRKPSLFRLYTDKENKYDVAKHAKFLMENYNLSQRDFRCSLLRNPWIINLGQEELQNRIEFLRTSMGMTHKEVRRLLIVYPTTFNSHPDEIAEKIRILQDFLSLHPRTIGIIAARFPFFLRNKTKYLKDNVIELLRRSFSKQQIISIMKRHSEAFTVKPSHLKLTFDLPRKSRMTKEQTADVFTEYPRFFTIDATKIQPRKIKVFKRFGMGRRRGYKIMRKFPRIFIKSYGSLVLKMRYLRERMEIDLTEEKSFPYILNFDYSTIIRPRGELMIAKKKILPWTEVLQLKDEEFVQKIDGTLEELNKLKKDFKTVNNELDYKRRYFSRYFSNSGVNAKY